MSEDHRGVCDDCVWDDHCRMCDCCCEPGTPLPEWHVGVEVTPRQMAQAVVREAERETAAEAHAQWIEQATGIPVVRRRRRSP